MSRPAMVRLRQLAAAAELPIIVLISPALLLPTSARLLVLAILPLVWWCVRSEGQRVIPSTPLNLPLWIMVAMVGLSSLHASFDVQLSLGKLSGILLGLLLYWSIVRWLTSASRLRVALAVFVLVGAGLAVIGLLGTNPPDKYPALGLSLRLPMLIRGVPGAEEGFNPNPVAGSLVLFIPLQIALLASGANHWRFSGQASQLRSVCLIVLQVVLLVLTSATVFLMQSRGAWLALAVSAVAVLTWWSRVVRILVSFALAGVVVFVVITGPQKAASDAVQRAATMGVESAVRVELWSRGVRAIRDFPVTGIGVNTSRKFLPIRYSSTLPAIAPRVGITHVHNQLLQTAVDLGLPGLIAYGSVWLLVGVLLARVYRHASERTYRLVAGGLGAGLIAHFMFGLADAIPLGAKVGVVFWLAIALSVGLHHVALLRPRK